MTPREGQPAPRLPLFFQRRFLPMWVMVSFGTFADNVLRQALLIGIPAGIIAVPLFARPDDAMPFIGALLPAAILIFSSISGQLADKYETSMMFRRTKFTEIMLMCLAAFAFMSGSGALAILMLFAMGAQSAFFSPVRVSAMPKYLTPDELVRGNALCNAGLFTFILLGYVVGAYLIVSADGWIIGSVLISAALVGFTASLFTLEAAPNAPALKLSFNPPLQTIKMFRHVFDAAGVAPPLLGVGVFYFFSTAITVLTPLYGRDALHADPLVWAALNALFAVGAGVGAIGASNIPKQRSGLGISAIAIFTAGLLCVSMLVFTPLIAGSEAAPFTLAQLFGAPSGWLLCGLFVTTAALSGLYIAPLQAAMQRRAPKETCARIMAASVFSNAAFAIPGSLSVLFITRTGANPTLGIAVMGLFMIGVSALMWRRSKSLPAGLYDDMLPH